MKEVFANLAATLVVLITIVIGLLFTFDVILGLFEIAYWIVTGDWFHFVTVESISVF